MTDSAMKNTPKPENDAATWVSGRTAAFLVGIDPSHITNLKNQGFISAPTGVSPNKGKYHLPTIMRELYEYAQRQGGGGGSLSDRTAELDYKNKELRFKRQEREEAQELGQLIPFEDAVAITVEANHKVSGQLENIITMLERKCALTPDQIEQAEKVIFGTMEAIAEEYQRAGDAIEEAFPQHAG